MERSRVHPISFERHGNKAFKPLDDLTFARRDAIAEITGQELVQVAKHLPTAFVKKDDSFVLVVVMGVEPGHNLLINEEGKWLGRYLPQNYGIHPFCFQRNTDGEVILSVIEDSDSYIDSPESENSKHEIFSFFEKDGNLSHRVSEIKGTIERIVTGKALTDKICKFLQENELIKQWSITINDGSKPDGLSNSEPRSIQGLYCIDEVALNLLSGNRLAELRDMSGLWIAYCQIMSMSNLSVLGQLRNTQIKEALTDESFLRTSNQDGNISFENI